MNSAPSAVALRAAIRLGGQTATGIDLRTERPVVTLAPDVVDALADDGEAGWRFQDLSYSRQRRFVRAIEGSRTGETRRRRIAETVATLRADRG